MFLASVPWQVWLGSYVDEHSQEYVLLLSLACPICCSPVFSPLFFLFFFTPLLSSLLLCSLNFHFFPYTGALRQTGDTMLPGGFLLCVPIVVAMDFTQAMHHVRTQTTCWCLGSLMLSVSFQVCREERGKNGERGRKEGGGRPGEKRAEEGRRIKTRVWRRSYLFVFLNLVVYRFISKTS